MSEFYSFKGIQIPWGVSEHYVDYCRYHDLVAEAEENNHPPEKPKPPLKRSIEIRNFWSYKNEKEYDHHAPGYIESLKKWEERYSQWCREQTNPNRNLRLYCPWGSVTIKMEVQIQEDSK